ncbi:helix-turn-helix domain-containing protein [Ligilactobacillus saerimneri]|uniref:Helix-turn-helix domain-containing protein n=1 Tax=Ligilactobacillus saerimneri TaxID=228229 RepID=A0A7H9EKD9_9LACO|nr:helix-turn-helix transcriptional regulator [Ligilactobacillus saerimneri]MCZ0892010.1 helix-turn-helix transcriptional regulator [Ligilactobacillus saerimneri]QLL78183.1 helix-turn-helix domain-containing protein [Ligilactobacillus saerimneri]
MNTLKVLRAKKDVSQQELGEKLGVSQNTVSSWEQGYTRPSTKNMLKMSDFFEISLSEIYDIFFAN